MKLTDIKVRTPDLVVIVVKSEDNEVSKRSRVFLSARTEVVEKELAELTETLDQLVVYDYISDPELESTTLHKEQEEGKVFEVNNGKHMPIHLLARIIDTLDTNMIWTCEIIDGIAEWRSIEKDADEKETKVDAAPTFQDYYKLASRTAVHVGKYLYTLVNTSLDNWVAKSKVQKSAPEVKVTTVDADLVDEVYVTPSVTHTEVNPITHTESETIQ